MQESTVCRKVVAPHRDRRSRLTAVKGVFLGSYFAALRARTQLQPRRSEGDTVRYNTMGIEEEADRTLFVRNLDSRVTEELLFELFLQVMLIC